MKLERPKTSHPQPEEEAKQEQKTKDWKGDFPQMDEIYQVARNRR